METVLGNTGAIATTPNFLERKRDHLECESMHLCAGSLCHEEPVLRSKCKTVRYCGQEPCQSWHWKNGHKVRCFKTDY
ncbi:hypothetical protein DFH08DRAFT_93721 [Mycena albidolilacea]|uniref:Uncharacterized protein n=1 Tax=Mycena albidolilacea TaxID=1033008 RepID=A0AAD6YZX7_9AGAR|nr:hypothetical protein DFH08DRAFT_93721 [Mycena albidolilacea]